MGPGSGDTGPSVSSSGQLHGQGMVIDEPDHGGLLEGTQRHCKNFGQGGPHPRGDQEGDKAEQQGGGTDEVTMIEKTLNIKDDGHETLDYEV